MPGRTLFPTVLTMLAAPLPAVMLPSDLFIAWKASSQLSKQGSCNHAGRSSGQVGFGFLWAPRRVPTSDAGQARRAAMTSSMLRRAPSLTVFEATSLSPCARGMPSSRVRLRVTLPGVDRAGAACAPSAWPTRGGVAKPLGGCACAAGGGAGGRGGDAPLGGRGAAGCAYDMADGLPTGVES